jgi:redox-sensing transcriptional repressor
VAYLEDKLQSEGIRLGIIAVPESAASDIAHRLTQGGVKAILSFAPCQLITSDNLQITCVDLATEMARLVYYL